MAGTRKSTLTPGEQARIKRRLPRFYRARRRAITITRRGLLRLSNSLLHGTRLTPMKFARLITLLLVGLGMLPAQAQQGPAGIPGLFDLIESIAEPTPAEHPRSARKPATQPKANEAIDTTKQNSPNKNSAVDCRTAKRGTPCLTRKANTRQAKPSTRSAAPATSCQQSSNPTRCKLFQNAYEQCKDKLGAAHQSCLHEMLLPK